MSITLAAVTAELDWGFRTTCSHDRFNPATARAYIADRAARSLRLMEQAAEQGADLVLGPEYFAGSELFMRGKGVCRELVEPLDGPTVTALRALSARRGVHLAASLNLLHGDHVIQTAVLTGRDGSLAGVHLKHNSLPPDGPFQPSHNCFDLDIGRTGILICADCGDSPLPALEMGRRGVQLLLVPGVGFAGELWRDFIRVRAHDQRCTVVYADNSRALIAGPKGQVLAETHEGDSIILAKIP
jgi:predicted amidohydrolase